MTREQIETILKRGDAKQDKDGAYALPEGSNMTLHVSHDGASLSFQKVETVKFEGDLLFARSAKATVAIVMSDTFAVTVEGAAGQPARRPAGFM